MKKMVFLSVCIFLMGLNFTDAEEKKSVRLVATVYPPYHDPGLKNGGFQEELVKKAFERVGYEVTTDYKPWARALAETERGKYDGIIGLWFREEREAFFAFSEPIGANEIVFFKRKDKNITFQSYVDLRPYKIGIVRDYANPPEFEKAGYLRKQVVTSDNLNLKKLHKERVDLIVIDKKTAQHLIKKMPPGYAEKLEWMEPVLKKDLQYIGFSKKTDNYQIKLNDFNRGLKEIRDDGTFDKILEKHGF